MALPSLHIRILDRRAEAADETVRQQAARFQAMGEVCQLFNALPHPLLILNRQREIVFANRTLLNLLGCVELDCVLGLRPGDVLDCEHAWDHGPGCGKTEACEACGAARAISLCQDGIETVQECRIIQNTGTALDLRATSTPFRLDGEMFTVLTLTDISHEKRRRVLERVFFHDLLNMTAGVMGYAELLTRVPQNEIPEISRLIARLVRELAEEIRSHRDLSLAETQDLTVRWEPVDTAQALTDVIESARCLEVAQDRKLQLHSAAALVTLLSDKLLLTRILGNMLKNALEASPPGGTVTIGCRANNEQVEFWVHNQGAMPREVQLQVFQRSFSTKGPGRGLGTYSIKLLTERYLHGKVAFTSTPQTGTIFTVSFPRHNSHTT